MSLLKTGLKWLAIAVLVVLVLGALLWGASRFWPMSEPERRALIVMRAPPPAEGRNGYALLWTLDRDGIDDATRLAALAVDAASWRADPQTGGNIGSSAADQYKRVDYPQERHCSAVAGTCLAEVRSDPQRFVRSHAGHEALHARVAEVAGFDHFSAPWDTKAAAMMFPTPSFIGLSDPVSAHALAHVQGDSASAVRGLCEGISAGRRLLSGGDTLIASMLGGAMIERNGSMLGEVVAELPRDRELPAACTAALQPMRADETSLCRAMQGELELGGMVLRHAAREPGASLVLDVERSKARIATGLSWACDPAQQRQLAEDRVIAPPPLPAHGISCVANAMGCVLTDVSVSTFLPYAGHSQDAAAMVRLLAAQQWLRAQPDAAASALSRLPLELRSSSRMPALSADGRWLQVPRRYNARAPDDPVVRVPVR